MEGSIGLNLDLIFFLLLAAFGLFGFMTGFWSQVIKLIALTGAYLLAGSLSGPLGEWLGLGLKTTPLLGRVVGMVLAFLVLYIGLSFLGWAVVRAWRSSSDRSHGLSDRLGGAVLGSAKAFVVLYLLLCFFALMEEPLTGYLPGEKKFTENSRMLAAARKHNLLKGLELPAVQHAMTLTRVAIDPKLREKAAHDPNVKRLLKHPKIHALLHDEALISACEQKQFGAVLSNPKVNEALEDPEVTDLLKQINLENLDAASP